MGFGPGASFFPSVLSQVTRCQSWESRVRSRLENDDGSLAGTLAFVSHIVRLRWTEDGAEVSTTYAKNI